MGDLGLATGKVTLKVADVREAVTTTVSSSGQGAQTGGRRRGSGEEPPLCARKLGLASAAPSVTALFL